ncbi:MAG: dTMP kinase [Candidatus Hermodarchaeota archaeon]
MGCFIDAYYAFQSCARGISEKFLEFINLIVSEGIWPDLTFLLDLAPEIALARLDPSSMHRFEKEPIDFHSKVRAGYLIQAEKYFDRIK